MRPDRWLAALALAGVASPSVAGPPYQTDDPEPTDLHHWEIYNFATVDGRRGDVDGSAGLDLNYGAAEGLQLTATLPLAFQHRSASGWREGRGDLQLGAKYRFVDDEDRGWQAAVFPRAILPTSSTGLGGSRIRVLLPLWAQKTVGKTSVFGGGGYEINPGPGNRDFFVAGLALTHEASKTLSIGAELSWQSADTRSGKSSTGLNFGLIQKLGGPYSLLLAGGPTFAGVQTNYHVYTALALNY